MRDHSRVPRAVAVAVAVVVGCAKASRVDPHETTLARIETMPPMAITLPPFMRAFDIVDPPVVYMFQGGSLSEGLLAWVMIGLDPRSGPVPTKRELPRCSGEELVEYREGREIVTCDEGLTGRSIQVRYTSERGDIACRASWTSSEPIAESRKEDARDVEAACSSLRFL
jgi:hypothetical protein